MAQQNKLFSIYGAKKSKQGNRYNISLIRSEGENKEWACISLDPSNEKSKTIAQVKGEFLFVKIPILKPQPRQESAKDPFEL